MKLIEYQCHRNSTKEGRKCFLFILRSLEPLKHSVLSTYMLNEYAVYKKEVLYFICVTDYMITNKLSVCALWVINKSQIDKKMSYT